MGISVGLGLSALLPAGLGFRNLLINGNFSINQRVFTSTTTQGAFGFDRWYQINNDGTTTYSAQTFTVGNAISGQESKNHARMVTTGQTSTGAYSILVQKIEGVRSLAGQTAIISFWAKAASGTPKISIEFEQHFGTGGSPSSTVQTYVGQSTISTSWVRYQLSVVVPSISGKTIGSNNDDSLSFNMWFSGGSTFNSRNGSLGIQSNTFDIWGVQVEANYQLTPFEQRPYGVELALCQRYYYRRSQIGGYNFIEGMGMGVNFNNGVFASFQNPVEMRSAPVYALVSGTTGVDAYGVAGSATYSSQVTTTKGGRINFSTSGLTDYRPYFIIGNSSATVEFSSEL
jgi:hypothetical protein